MCDFIAGQRSLPFTYPEAGASFNGAPAGYRAVHQRTRIGTGEEDFERGMRAIERWTMYSLGWGSVFPADAPIEPGETVGLVIRSWFLWSLNACRIIYVMDVEDGPMRRYGFGFGTTPEHAVIGEERFMVEWDRSDDSVWYDIFSFSRPGHPLTRIGYPLLRHMQKRFARDSAAAMIRAVSDDRRLHDGASTP
ncbi:MAG: hypothetical protein JWQ98_1177 [Chlorobi bacterium]|nr:hypothetical protein [Chlorobiota bacterium]